MRSVDFLAIEPLILKLEGTSMGIRSSIYILQESNDETPQKVPIRLILEVKADGVISILKHHAEKGYDILNA